MPGFRECVFYKSIEDFGGVVTCIFEEMDGILGEREVNRLADSGDLRLVLHSDGFPCPISPVATDGRV
jgi:hypothetical protein